MKISWILVIALAVTIVLGYPIILFFRSSPGTQAELYEGDRGIPGVTGTSRILDVPFVQQKRWYCSEASASMVLKYYQNDISQDQVHDNGYESFEDMEPFLSQFVNCEYASLDVDGLREEIDQGDPVIIRILPGKYRHTIVVVGYDEDYLYAHDPAYGAFLKTNPEVLLTYWEPVSFAAIIFTG